MEIDFKARVKIPKAFDGSPKSFYENSRGFFVSVPGLVSMLDNLFENSNQDEEQRVSLPIYNPSNYLPETKLLTMSLDHQEELSTLIQGFVSNIQAKILDTCTDGKDCREDLLKLYQLLRREYVGWCRKRKAVAPAEGERKEKRQKVQPYRMEQDKLSRFRKLLESLDFKPNSKSQKK